MTVRFRGFELDPGAPAVREQPVVAHLAAKYGTSLADAEAMPARVGVLARADGLTFQLSQARSGNTFDAHRLLHLAWETGRHSQLKDALFRAYFTEGRAIGDRDESRSVAVTAGLASEDVERLLASDDYAAAVREDQAAAAGLGVSGVPFLVFDRRVAVSWAQPTDLLLKALRQVHAEPSAA